MGSEFVVLNLYCILLYNGMLKTLLYLSHSIAALNVALSEITECCNLQTIRWDIVVWLIMIRLALCFFLVIFGAFFFLSRDCLWWQVWLVVIFLWQISLCGFEDWWLSYFVLLCAFGSKCCLSSSCHGYPPPGPSEPISSSCTSFSVAFYISCSLSITVISFLCYYYGYNDFIFHFLSEDLLCLIPQYIMICQVEVSDETYFPSLFLLLDNYSCIMLIVNLLLLCWI